MRLNAPLFVTFVGALAFSVGCGGCKGGGGASVDEDAAPSTPPTAPVNALPIPSASVAKRVNPSNLPVYDGPTGSIEGTISIIGDPAPDTPDADFSKCPEGRATYGKLFRDGPPGPDGARPLADALVVVTEYKGFVPEGKEAKHVVIDHCALPSRTITLTFGQRLEVSNKMQTLVAPSFIEQEQPAMMVAPPEERGDPVKLYPPNPGHFTLHDRLGSYLRTDVWAFHHPFHTVSGLDGHYRIDGIPIGNVKVGTRLSAIGQNAERSVDILAGVVQKVDLTLTYKKETAPPPPKLPANAGPRLH